MTQNDNNSGPPPEKKESDLRRMVKLLAICFTVVALLFAVVAVFPDQTRGLQKAMSGTKNSKGRSR